MDYRRQRRHESTISLVIRQLVCSTLRCPPLETYSKTTQVCLAWRCRYLPPRHCCQAWSITRKWVKMGKVFSFKHILICHYFKYQYYTARIYAKSSLFCGIITIGLFLYILLVPWLKSTRPNVWPSLSFHFTLISHIWAHVPSLQYSKWRQSGELSTVVPVRIVFNATQIAYILNISSIIYPDINRPHGPWVAPFVLYSQPLDGSRSHKRSDSL